MYFCSHPLPHKKLYFWATSIIVKRLYVVWMVDSFTFPSRYPSSYMHFQLYISPPPSQWWSSISPSLASWQWTSLWWQCTGCHIIHSTLKIWISFILILNYLSTKIWPDNCQNIDKLYELQSLQYHRSTGSLFTPPIQLVKIFANINVGLALKWLSH